MILIGEIMSSEILESKTTISIFNNIHIFMKKRMTNTITMGI